MRTDKVLISQKNRTFIGLIPMTNADTKTDIGADGKASLPDREESVSLMEPMLVSEGSRFRSELTDLAIDLAGRSSGFRRSLPEGIVAALADLVRLMNYYYNPDNEFSGRDCKKIG
jgi:hypothetical protein